MRVIFAACWIAASLFAQQTGRISGRAVHAALGDPVAGVKLTLNFSAATVVTAPDGSFEFTGLAAGSYTIVSEKEGFAGTKFRPALTLNLAAGESREGILLRLHPAAQISGRILNADGEPVNASVTLQQADTQAHIALARSTPAGFTISNLEPGRYRLHAQEWAALNPKYGTTYYPSTLEPLRAETIVLAAGEARSDVDLKLQLVEWITIKGRFLGACPSPNSCRVIYSFQDNRSGGSIRTGLLDAEGHFTLQVPPAPLRLSVNYYPSGAGRMKILGHADVNVPPGAKPESLGEIIIRASEPRDLRARFVWPAGIKPAAATKLSLSLNPHGGRGVFQVAESDGGQLYSANAVSPDVYGVQVRGLPAGTYVERILAGADDITQRGLDLTLGPPPDLSVVIASGAASIKGKVSSASPIPNNECLVTLRRDSPHRQEIELYAGQADCNGQAEFTLPDIAPGAYLLRVFVNGKTPGPQKLNLKPNEQLNLSIPIP